MAQGHRGRKASLGPTASSRCLGFWGDTQPSERPSQPCCSARGGGVDRGSPGRGTSGARWCQTCAQGCFPPTARGPLSPSPLAGPVGRQCGADTHRAGGWSRRKLYFTGPPSPPPPPPARLSVVGAEQVLGRGGREGPPSAASLLGSSGPIMSTCLSGQRRPWWCSGWGGATSLGAPALPPPTAAGEQGWAPLGQGLAAEEVEGEGAEEGGDAVLAQQVQFDELGHRP